MQTSGSFPALYGRQGGHPYGARGKSVGQAVAGAQSPNPIAPPKKRRQTVMPQTKTAQNPLGAITGNPALAAMVGRALNVNS